jgi:hypothetical protein
MRSFAMPVAAILIFSVGAKAEPPKLVGDWTRTVLYSAQLGEHSGYPPATTPRFSGGAATDWTMKIDKQEGNSFSGAMKGPSGQAVTIIGTFLPDGKHFVFATDEDTGSGETTSDEMQYCWARTSPKFMGTGCATFKRDK